MRIRARQFRVVLAMAGLLAAAGQRAHGQAAGTEHNTLPFQVLRWSSADQTAWVNANLEKGMPTDQGDTLVMLALNRSSLTLPLMEQKIEQVLRSTSPSECFTEGSVNPVVFVSLAAETIAYAGNAEAVRQIGKLIKLDEKRFGDLVDRALMEAEDARGGNPYVLAYQGLELGDPLVQKRVYAWFQARLVDKDEYRLRDLRKFWAEALVDRYGGAPTGSQWAADPFVSRVNPSDEPALHKAMLGLTIDVVQRRQKQ